MIVFIVGKKLSGKSYTTKQFLQRTKRNVVIIDPLMEYEADQRFFTAASFIAALKNGPLRKRVAITP